MLITDLNKIGNNLYKIRRLRGLTQAEAAERADLSDRAYADIERGSTSMRVDTLLKICAALRITPNDLLVEEDTQIVTEQDIAQAIKNCSPAERETALKLLSVYAASVK